MRGEDEGGPKRRKAERASLRHHQVVEGIRNSFIDAAELRIPTVSMYLLAELPLPRRARVPKQSCIHPHTLHSKLWISSAHTGNASVLPEQKSAFRCTDPKRGAMCAHYVT